MMLSRLMEKFCKSMKDAEGLIRLKKDEINGDTIMVASLPNTLSLVVLTGDAFKSKTELQKILENTGQNNESLIITMVNGQWT